MRDGAPNTRESFERVLARGVLWVSAMRISNLLRLACLTTSVSFFSVAGCAGGSFDPSVDETSAAVTSRKGLDYSFARPSPSGLHSGGYTFAARYLSYDNSSTHGKILFAAEAKALIAAGVDVVSNWEYAADDALSGNSAGVNDAKAAAAQAAAAGMPATRPIYFSVDFDATPAQQTAINAYMDGAASVLGRNRVGAYGGYYVIKRLFDAGKISWGWQTYAWSGGQWDARAQLRQTQNGITAAGDGDCCDLDVSEADDFGQWGYSSPWAAKFVSQSWPLATTAITIKCGQSVAENLVLRNVGTKAWDANTRLGTTEPRDRASRFAGADWLATNRPSHVAGSVAPNATYTFKFTFTGPTGAACVPGTYKEYFGVVEEGTAWFSDAAQGGPPDNQLEALINLVPGDPPADMAHAPAHDGGTGDVAEDMGPPSDGEDAGSYGPDGGDGSDVDLGDTGGAGGGGDGTGDGTGTGGNGDTGTGHKSGCSFGGSFGSSGSSDGPLGGLAFILALFAGAYVARAAGRKR